VNIGADTPGGPSRDKRARRQLAEPEEIEAALLRGEPVQVLVHRRDDTSPTVLRLVELARERDVSVVAVSDRELRRSAAQPETARVLACMGSDPAEGGDAVFAQGGAVWLLVGTAYPGNAGFVIRTAEVSGADGVVVDADFDRTARRDAGRAAMRADRYLPVEFEASAECTKRARGAGYRVIAIEDAGAVAPWDVDLTGPVLFIVGGEARGIPKAQLEQADHIVRIPMAGFMPSYNLQAAMAAVMSERLRQEAGPRDAS
jgi:tRNA G18 (ribose-2'-O)-methylase SpoU